MENQLVTMLVMSMVHLLVILLGFSLGNMTETQLGLRMEMAMAKMKG